MVQCIKLLQSVSGKMKILRNFLRGYSNMAMVLYQSGDPAEASIYQQKSVIINERVQGLDHHETAQSYVRIFLEISFL